MRDPLRKRGTLPFQLRRARGALGKLTLKAFDRFFRRHFQARQCLQAAPPKAERRKLGLGRELEPLTQRERVSRAPFDVAARTRQSEYPTLHAELARSR
jgi:hypothetical protein